MRHLWWIVFLGFVGGSYLYLQQPEQPGATAAPATFRWSMLWAPDSALPPSDRLAPYMGRGLESVVGPLDGKNAPPPPPAEVGALAEKFRTEAAKAPAEKQPIYQAATAVCKGLVGALEARRKARAALVEARANVLSFRNPLTGQLTPNRVFLENNIVTGWARESTQRRQNLTQWYTLLQKREHERGIYGLIGK